MEALTLWRSRHVWPGGSSFLYAAEDRNGTLASRHPHRRRYYNAHVRVTPGQGCPTSRRDVVFYQATHNASAMCRCLSSVSIPRVISSSEIISGGAMMKWLTHACMLTPSASAFAAI